MRQNCMKLHCYHNFVSCKFAIVVCVVRTMHISGEVDSFTLHRGNLQIPFKVTTKRNYPMLMLIGLIE